ncbi:Methanogenesis regulatory histidine kinase FilI [uncultured archaeon]|nr:Methanogenesis regulatory histidine kinase FilI [uncultured archaeon]
MEERLDRVFTLRHDLKIIIILSSVVFLISAALNFQNRIDGGFLIQYGQWGISEALVFISFLGVALSVYYYMGLRETKDQLEMRRQAEMITRDRLLRTKAFHVIDREILSNLPIIEIIKSVIKNVPKELGGDVVAISMDGMHFAKLPAGDIVEEDVISVSDDIMKCFDENKTAIGINNLDIEPRVAILSERIKHLRSPSYLCVPMVAKDRTIGVMHLLSQTSKVFVEEDIEFFTALASKAAIAVERAKMTAALRQSEAELKRAQIVSRTGNWSMDVKANELMWSDETYRIFGVPIGSSMTFEKFLERVHLDDRELVHAKWTGALRGEPYNIEHRIIVNGELKWVNELADFEFDKDGKALKGFGTVQDVTERKAAQEMRIEKERLEFASRAKSEFIVSMSHELRAPLNSIMGFSDLLKMKLAGDLNEKQVQYIDSIYSEGSFLLILINDILDLSKVEAGKIILVIEKVNLHATIEEALLLIREKALKQKIDFKLDFDPHIEIIGADRQRVKQILYNLLSNAVKFSKEEGGTVTITTKKEGDMAQISVSDTGIGMKPENMGRLFQRFEQLEPGISMKYGGTGLGLSICKQLVELHGGKIWAKSEPGEGSTFTFTLPIEIKKSAPDKNVIIEKTI